MKKIKFEIIIGASKEVVWDKLITLETYKIWTMPFNPSSSYEGDLEKVGSRVKFLGADENGEEGGMLSEIAECRKNEYLSIKHIGMIKKGVEDTESEAVKKWSPAFENYTLSSHDGMTKFEVDIDCNEEWESYFNETWPKALLVLKEICEA